MINQGCSSEVATLSSLCHHVPVGKIKGRACDFDESVHVGVLPQLPIFPWLCNGYIDTHHAEIIMLAQSTDQNK